jgi:hypothetical protein
MSHITECDFQAIRSLLESSSDNSIALDILELYIVSNEDSLNVAIREIMED